MPPAHTESNSPGAKPPSEGNDHHAVREQVDDVAHPRHIRSFVRRRGHITERQKAAFANLAPQWSVPYQTTPIDPVQVFGREAPLILEIGFGMGETTAKIAAERPDEDFLGVEVFEAGIGALAQRLHEQNLTNVRMVQHDAVEVVEHMLSPGMLAGIHVYFPDPWPKKRHHKRRLIQGPFVELLASRLTPGGYLHCATDWEHYAHQMLEVLGNEPTLVNDAPKDSDGFSDRPVWRPETKFEARGKRLGHGVWDLIFRRRPDKDAS